jgi:hypothetical protein
MEIIRIPFVSMAGCDSYFDFQKIFHFREVEAGLKGMLPSSVAGVPERIQPSESRITMDY